MFPKTSQIPTGRHSGTAQMMAQLNALQFLHSFISIHIKFENYSLLGCNAE